MRMVTLGAAVALLTVGTGACKDPEQVAEQKKVRTAQDQIQDGKKLLSQGRADLALPEFKAAAAAMPMEADPVLLIAQAHRELGNEGAAILALKQALDLTHGADPGVKKQLADALRQDGHLEEAIAFLIELRDSKLLSDHELLQLARAQGQAGDSKGAYKTLEEIQRVRPDDPEAKVVEAELLMIAGDTELAMKILERLVAADPPNLAEVRAVRARYYLGLGEIEKAQTEVDAIPPEQLATPELAQLHADVLIAEEKFEDADSALGVLLEARPRDPEVLSRLAEVKLSLGQASTADMLVEQALGVRPKSSRGLYMRGRIAEEQGELDRAAEFYNQALASDSAFFPALARTWRIHQQQGSNADAMSDLERLLFMNKATLDEKVALVELYANSKTQLPRARKLIAEAIAKDPKSDRLRELQKKLGAGPSAKKRQSGGVEILSPFGGKRRR